MSKLLDVLHQQGFDVDDLELDEIIDCHVDGSDWKLYITKNRHLVSHVGSDWNEPLLFILLVSDEEFDEESEKALEDCVFESVIDDGLYAVEVPKSWF